MAIIDDNSLNKDENKDNEQELSGAPSSSRISAFSTGTPQAPQGKSGSGRFTNLQKYINANQGAGEQMASRLSNATNRDIEAFNADYSDKTTRLNQGIDEAKNLFENQGGAFKNQLNQFNTGLNTFGGFGNRQEFDTTGQNIRSFVQQPQFADFQKLQSSQGLDENPLLDIQSQAKLSGQNVLGNIQNKVNQIQTEQGRYDLLQQSLPQYGDKVGSGGNRLNQLFFQTNPNAVSQLQGSFQNQANQIKSQNENINQIGGNLNNIIAQEAALANDLNLGARSAQDTFYNQLNKQSNFDDVNAARQDLYNDYANQIRTGKFSADLTDMLGLGNLGTYNPTRNIESTGNTVYSPEMGRTFSSGVSQKMTPNLRSPSQNNITGDQFRLYNVINNLQKDPLTGQADVGGFLQKGRNAQTFQDLLLQPDFDTYNALAQLSGINTGKATGVSTLDKAVSASPINSLAREIQLADKNFVDNSINRVYDSLSAAERSYRSGDIFNNSTGSDRNDIANVIGDGKSPLWTGPEQKTLPIGFDSRGGAVGIGYAKGDLNDYLYNENTPLTTQSWLPYGGDSAANTAAQLAALGQAQRNVKNQIDQAVSSSGVKNVADIDRNKNVQETEKYKKFKGLL